MGLTQVNTSYYLGQNHHMGRNTDIEAAFRQYPVHRDDCELLRVQWRGKYYSIRSSRLGYVVPRGLSDALEWIAVYQLLISFVDHPGSCMTSS